MPRPMKKGLSYFPMDTDFFASKTVKGLRRELGAVGILTYVNLLCRIYGNGWFYRFYSPEELSMDIAEDLTSVRVKTTAEEVTEALRYCIDHALLDADLFAMGIATGKALQEQYLLSVCKAKRHIGMDAYCLVDVGAVLEKNGIRTEGTEVAARGRQKTVPADAEILAFFTENLSDPERAAQEALRFKEYNAARAWSCMPSWHVAAARWLDRIK